MLRDPYIFVFNSPLSSGCDYVLQTVRRVARMNPAYGIALGDIVWLPKLLFTTKGWIVRRQNGVTMVRPVSLVPGVGNRWVRLITYMFTAAAVRVFVSLRYRSAIKSVWFFEPFHIGAVWYPFAGYRSVYDCVDYFPGFSDAAATEHAWLLLRASYVFANSIPLARELKRTRPDVHTVPLGAATSLFSGYRVRPLLPHKKQFVVGFAGGISDRIDFPLLRSLVLSCPDMMFVFAGPLEVGVFGRPDNALAEFRALCLLPNVRWQGALPKDKVPDFIRSIDVGIIPYRTHNPFNKFSFPMKTMEYFLVGKPVVTTDIRSLRQYDGTLLLIRADARRFAYALKHIYRHGWSGARQAAQRKEALKHSWENKVAAILAVLGK
jgi:glycosyltransferase involved in cell wall biosynthesis